MPRPCRFLLFNSVISPRTKKKRLHQSVISPADACAGVTPPLPPSAPKRQPPLPVTTRLLQKAPPSADTFRSPSAPLPLPIGWGMKRTPAGGHNGSKGFHAVHYYGDREGVHVAVTWLVPEGRSCPQNHDNDTNYRRLADAGAPG